MESHRYVDIAVDIPSQALWGTYTYSVPEGMRDRARAGCIAIVPFGHRRVRGFVLGPAAAPPDGVREIRSILSTVDPCTALPSTLMDLAREVSREYCSPIQVALRAMLPPGLGGAGRSLVRLAPGRENLEELSGALTPREWDVVNVLAEDGERTPAEISEMTGIRDIASVIKTLSARGIVTQETVFRKPASARVYLEVSLAREVSEEEISRMTVSAPRRTALLSLIIGEGKPVPAAEAVRRSGAGQSSLRGLEKAGLIRIDRVNTRPAEAAGRPPGAQAGRPVPGEDAERASASVLEALGREGGLTSAGGPRVCLLFGGDRDRRAVVYASVVDRMAGAGRGAIILVPEIGLTPRAGMRFGEWFGDRVTVLHSDISQGERYGHWKDIAEGGSDLVVGTRSAVFAPMSNPSAIVLDDEHHDSFKQEEGHPKYHARDVALMRAAIEGAGVVLGSATPSVETYYRALSGEYSLVRMAPGPGPSPACAAVDMRDEIKSGNRTLFSRRLQEEIRSAVSRGQRAVLFLNRRGFSSFVMCRECGLTLRCDECEVAFTYHSGGVLKCHYCGREKPAPDTCPRCGGRRMKPFGAGTQRVEDEVRRLFPSARVVRVDSDTASRKSSYNALLKAFRDGKVDILVGSGMVAGCDDLPPVAVVGVMSADLTLNLPDFRSAERTFQALEEMSRVAGFHRDGIAVIQTYDGGHYSIAAACSHDYEAFYRYEIESRRELGYPPFGHLVNVVILNRSDVTARALGKDAAKRLGSTAAAGGYQVLGPVSAPFSRLRGWSRWQVLMKGHDRTAMAGAAKDLSLGFDKKIRSTGSRMSIDVDPVSML